VANTPASRAAVTGTALLTKGLAAGDEEAFREFHQTYFNRLYRFLLVVCGGREQEAQDALQETLARVVRHVRVFEDEEVFWCWLKAVGRSAALDGRRKRRRYLALLQEFALRVDLHGRKPGAEEDGQYHDLLEENLGQLSLEDRRLIEGKYIAGETVRELATEMGLTGKAVESRLSRLRHRLRERMLQDLRSL